MRRLFAAGAVALPLVLAGCGDRPPPVQVGPSKPLAAIETPPPDYPEALACNGIGGKVQLRVRIETDGRIRQVEVLQGSGNAQLDASAQAAVRRWKFRPAMQAGKTVAQWIAVPMNFHVPQPRPERCFALDEQQADALKAK